MPALVTVRSAPAFEWSIGRKPRTNRAPDQKLSIGCLQESMMPPCTVRQKLCIPNTEICQEIPSPIVHIVVGYSPPYSIPNPLQTTHISPGPFVAYPTALLGQVFSHPTPLYENRQPNCLLKHVTTPRPDMQKADRRCPSHADL